MFRRFSTITKLDDVVSQVESDISPITFIGSVKLHGVQGCVGYKDGKIFVQSKDKIITVEKDNYGFAQWVENRKKEFQTLFEELIEYEKISKNVIIYIYGEFVGKNVRDGAGISNLKKSFFIFDIVLVEGNKERSLLLERPFLLSAYVLPSNTYSIYPFKFYKLEINFNDLNELEKAVRKIVALVKEVESECPVAKEFFPNKRKLVGKGIVWRSKCGKYYFTTP